MKKYSIHEHPHKKNAPVVPHSLPWEGISLWTAPTDIKHVHILDYGTHRANTAYNILIIPKIRGTWDLGEECTCRAKP